MAAWAQCSTQPSFIAPKARLWELVTCTLPLLVLHWTLGRFHKPDAWVRFMSAVNALRMCISSVLEKVLRQWVQCIHICTVETTTFVADKIIELDSHVAIDANEPEILLPCHTPFHHSHSYYKANALRTHHIFTTKYHKCVIGTPSPWWISRCIFNKSQKPVILDLTAYWQHHQQHHKQPQPEPLHQVLTYCIVYRNYYISICKHLTSINNISVYHR